MVSARKRRMTENKWSEEREREREGEEKERVIGRGKQRRGVAEGRRARARRLNEII